MYSPLRNFFLNCDRHFVSQLAIFCAVSMLILSSCSSAPNTASGDKPEVISDKPVEEAEPEEDLSEPVKKPSMSSEKTLSTAPVLTNVKVPAIEFRQQNEFLGSSVLKLSPAGVRLDSPNIAAVFPAGASGPTIFNPITGKSMLLTSKNSAFLRHAGGLEKGSGEVAKKIAVETIAGMKCIHFRIESYKVDPKTKAKSLDWTTEVWATRDLGLPSKIIDDCSKLTMIPPELGIPLRLVRESKPTAQEKSKGVEGVQRRTLIDTFSAKKKQLDKGEFILLVGYQPVKDEMELMMSGDKGELEAGLGDLEDMEKEPK